MPIQITMPRLSDTMQEGTLVKWRVQTGQAIKSGDALADVETDKATMELQSFDDGTVAKICVSEGQVAPVGALILVLAEKGENVEQVAASVSNAPVATSAKTPTSASDASAEESDQTDEEGQAISDGSKISPLARKIAQTKGIDLSTVQGTGPGGRIIKRDVLAASESPKAQAVAPTSVKPIRPAPVAATVSDPATLESKTIPVTTMRKTIARRLVESKSTIPHFTVSTTVDMDPLLALRETLNKQLADQQVKLSVNDFLVRACAMSLVKHPKMNSSWADDGSAGGAGIVQHGAINIGVAVALPEEKGGGLIVPTLRQAHAMGLRTISSETKRLAEKARTSGLTPQEMSDGTFTLSNLGMFGVDHFEAIINPPQAAILAVGGANAKPVVRSGQIVVGHEMTCTISGDHRVVDGAVVAAFLQTLKQMLENPATLLV